MHRAYSLLTLKAVDDDQRIITGTATTPEPDRIGDIVEPLGVRFKNPLPLLWQHRSDNPVGTVRFNKPTKEGITFTARMPKVEEPPSLKDRIDTAWNEIKLGLVRGVSIGFRSIERSFMDDGGIRFLETEVLELSLVTIPANAEATIESIKSIDTNLLTASGQKQGGGDRSNPAGVSASHTTVKMSNVMKKTIAEQIAGFEAMRKTKSDRMDAIMDEQADKGETLDAAQKEEYDGLEREVQEIDDHLRRLRVREKTNKDAAVAVDGSDQEKSSHSRGGGNGIIQVKSRKIEPGIPMTRVVIAKARAHLIGGGVSAVQVAESNEHWKDTPEVVNVLKTAVAAGTTTDSTWAAPLVEYQVMASEFIEYLRPLTIIGNIQGFRRVPFKIKIPRQTAGASVNWVGEGKVKPLTSLAFDSLTMDFYKVAGIVPLTEELVRFSSPSAEALVRDDLARAIAQFIDTEFVDPTKAEASGVSPASITNGVTPITATGTTAAALRADIKSLFAEFLSSNLAVSGGTWIMTQQQALSISMMRTALDQPEFPGLTMTGGTFFGFPVVVSENIPATGGSPTDGYPIIFLRAGDILLADDGGVNIDISREASLQMDTTPDSPATASTVMVSLWQHNMIAIKAERFINWKKRRAEAVGFIQNAKYVA